MKNKQYVFVVTYGRSGSTLLNGVLNSIPGYTIKGENNNAFYHLYQFYNSMIQAQCNNDVMQQNFNVKESRNSWWNDVHENSMKQYIQYLMNNTLDYYNNYRVVGFKEIRYYSIEDLSEYLNWLHDITNCRFIYLTRNLDDVVQSEWFKNNPEMWKDKLRCFESNIRHHITHHLNQQWYHICYNNFKEDLVGLFDFLGEEYKPDVIKGVLATPHGYKTNGKIKVIKYE